MPAPRQAVSGLWGPAKASREGTCHSKHRVHLVVALTVLKTRYAFQVEDLNIIYRVEACATPSRLYSSSTWHRSFWEGPVICSGLDQGVNNARHLGGDGDNCLAPQILVLAIFRNMPAEAIAQTIVALTDRHLGGQPKGSAQACVAKL